MLSPAQSATVTERVTNGSIRRTHSLERTHTPTFHCRRTSSPTDNALVPPVATAVAVAVVVVAGEFAAVVGAFAAHVSVMTPTAAADRDAHSSRTARNSSAEDPQRLQPLQTQIHKYTNTFDSK